MSLCIRVILCFVVLLAGAEPQFVDHPFTSTCAVKGSTVTLPCTFTPAKSLFEDGKEILLEITRVVWCKNHSICQGSTPSIYDSEAKRNNPRYQYLGDKKRNCTLQIRDIQNEDDTTFRFRMEVNFTRGHFTNRIGVNVTVIDGIRMRISSITETGVTEGGTVTLHCTALCTFHQLEVTWFRNGRALFESGPALQLSPVTAEDSGNYTCALKTKRGTSSLPYSLQVEADEAGGREGGGKLFLIVGVVLGILLAVIALILVLFFIRRRRAAAEDHRAVRGEMEQKQPDNMYEGFLPSAEQQTGRHPREASPDVEDVSYTSIQFKHKKQGRRVEEAEDAVIYSSVASRG